MPKAAPISPSGTSSNRPPATNRQTSSTGSATANSSAAITLAAHQVRCSASPTEWKNSQPNKNNTNMVNSTVLPPFYHTHRQAFCLLFACLLNITSGKCGFEQTNKMFLKNLRGGTMNFDTPPQALTICGEWNKIFEDTRHKRQAAPDCLFARAYPARPGGAARRAGNVPAEG